MEIVKDTRDNEVCDCKLEVGNEANLNDSSVRFLLYKQHFTFHGHKESFHRIYFCKLILRLLLHLGADVIMFPFPHPCKLFKNTSMWHSLGINK